MKEYYYILLENISSHKDSIEGALFFTTEEAELEWNFNGEQLTQFLNEIKKASEEEFSKVVFTVAQEVSEHFSVQKEAEFRCLVINRYEKWQREGHEDWVQVAGQWFQQFRSNGSQHMEAQDKNHDGYEITDDGYETVENQEVIIDDGYATVATTDDEVNGAGQDLETTKTQVPKKKRTLKKKKKKKKNKVLSSLASAPSASASSFVCVNSAMPMEPPSAIRVEMKKEQLKEEIKEEEKRIRWMQQEQLWKMDAWEEIEEEETCIMSVQQPRPRQLDPRTRTRLSKAMVRQTQESLDAISKLSGRPKSNNKHSVMEVAELALCSELSSKLRLKLRKKEALLVKLKLLRRSLKQLRKARAKKKKAKAEAAAKAKAEAEAEDEKENAEKEKGKAEAEAVKANAEKAEAEDVKENAEKEKRQKVKANAKMNAAETAAAKAAGTSPRSRSHTPPPVGFQTGPANTEAVTTPNCPPQLALPANAPASSSSSTDAPEAQAKAPKPAKAAATPRKATAAAAGKQLSSSTNTVQVRARGSVIKELPTVTAEQVTMLAEARAKHDGDCDRIRNMPGNLVTCFNKGEDIYENPPWSQSTARPDGYRPLGKGLCPFPEEDQTGFHDRFRRREAEVLDIVSGSTRRRKGEAEAESRSRSRSRKNQQSWKRMRNTVRYPFTENHNRA